jgi:hypothetical protein
VFCGKEHVAHLDPEKVRRWQAGEKIQNVWPEMSADDRETLISGTCPDCWNEHMESYE